MEAFSQNDSSYAFRTQEWFNLARGDILRSRKTPPEVSFLVGCSSREPHTDRLIWFQTNTPCTGFEHTLWNGSGQNAPWASTQGHSSVRNPPPAQRCRLSSETELRSLTELALKPEEHCLLSSEDNVRFQLHVKQGLYWTGKKRGGMPFASHCSD
jgi:hypothetical protein